MQRVNRFARYWDMIGNSGRFKNTLPLILQKDSFNRFLQLSDALYAHSGSTWKISLRRQFELIYQILTRQMDGDVEETQQLLKMDFERSGEKGKPPFIYNQAKLSNRTGIANKRQKKHL